MKGGARGCGNGQVAGCCSCECEKWMTGWNDVLYCAGWQGSCRCEGSKARTLVPFITKQIWPLQPSASMLMGKKYSGMLLYPQLTPLSGEKEISPASRQKDRSRVKNGGRDQLTALGGGTQATLFQPCAACGGTPSCKNEKKQAAL